MNFGAIFVSSAKFAVWGCCPGEQLFAMGQKIKKKVVALKDKILPLPEVK